MSKVGGIKKFFGKASCSIGIHKWDKWVYSTQSSCDQKAICLRCKKEGHRVRHDWGDWSYTDAASCVEILKCSHCGEAKFRTIHNWSDWTYTPHDNYKCIKERICMRCKEVESKLVSHSWTAWKEHINGDLRICRKCGHQQVTYEHDWTPWKEYKESWRKYEDPMQEALSGGDKRKCRRCDKEEKYPEHTWEEWTAFFSDKKGVKCARCGKKVTFD